MLYRFALVSGVWMLCHLAMSQEGVETHVPAEEREESAPSSAIDVQCRELVQVSQEMYKLLSEVADKEGADRAAGVLREKLARMSELLRSLESFPFDQAQDTEALKSHMATLTHISQLNLDTMQRLAEVNAYGSEALMGIFNRYKVDSQAVKLLDADDLPHTQLYGELADALESAILTLRQVQDETSARGSLAELGALLRQVETTHNKLSLLAPLHTDEQKEALRPVRERLMHISDELRGEAQRLQAEKCYRCAELDALLPRLLRPAAG